MLTILTPSPSKALTTASAVAAELPHDFAGDFALLNDMILRASAMVETACGRSFGRERIRETIHNRAHGGPVLPSRWPVVAIVAVTVDGREVDAASVQIDGGMFARTGSWGREVVVTYDAGYVLPTLGYADPAPPWSEQDRDLPYDIERVVIELVKLDWHMRNRDKSIRSEEVDGVSNIAFFGSGSTTDAIMAPLALYRMPVAL